MVKINKKNALFLHGVVIANGLPDTDNDVLTKEDIRKLNSSYVSHETDTNHDFLKNFGVEIIESYISKTEETVGDKKVPIGSWLVSMMVSDDKLKSNIRQGRLDGFSLASQPDSSGEVNIETLFKRNTYSDYKDVDALTPTFISIVKNAANKFKFDYYSYETYITKQKEEQPLSDETNGMVELTQKFLDFIQNNKNQDNKAVTKAAPPQGGIAPTMQQAPTQGAGQFGQPITLDTLNHKLDQLIQVMSNGIQPIKSEGSGNSDTSSQATSTNTADTGKGSGEITDATETSKTKASEEKKGDTLAPKKKKEETVKKAEQKVHDETQEPEGTGGGMNDGMKSSFGKDDVKPSERLYGSDEKGAKQKPSITKSEAPQTHKLENNGSTTQNKTTYDFGTKRDVLGRPLRK